MRPALLATDLDLAVVLNESLDALETGL